MSTVYRNGRSLSGEPLAFAVENGKFAHVGPDLESPAAIDLAGATVLPGFIDSHCHVIPTGFDLSRLFLGECRSRSEVLDAVRDAVRECGEGDWLHAVHYDQTAFSDSVHIHRDELDAVSPTTPILLRHTNGHAGVANSAALRAAGVTEDTSDPGGGEYVRDGSGRMTGVLLERANEHVAGMAPAPTQEQLTEAALKAAQAMAQYGITGATDMMTGYQDLLPEMEAYRQASLSGAKVRFRMFLQWSPVFGKRAVDPEEREALSRAMEPDRCRVIGAKVFADGAIGAGTAAIYGTYTSGGDGKLIYSEERLNTLVQTADKAGWRVSVHSIGDRCTDIVAAAFAATADPSRHRLEHATILSMEQVGRLADVGCHVTMQPEFVLWLGGAYVKQLGQEAAPSIKRIRSCLDAGIRMSLSSDRPITAGNPWDGILTAVTRPSPFGTEENITLEEAVDLYTRGGAEANGDEGRVGEIAEGQLADFQVYTNGVRGPEKPAPGQVFLGGELTFSKQS